jgi:hypothetical protein
MGTVNVWLSNSLEKMCECMKIRYVVLTLLMMAAWCEGTTKKVEVSNSSGATLYHYPVEIVLTTQINWAEIDPNFTSLRFFEDTNAIDYWIEFLDYANQKAVVWIRIPELPITGTTVYMNYSSEPNDPYKPVSYAAICPQPASRLTLKSYPLDASGGNFSGCHPCVVKAPVGSWISTAKTGDSQNVFWVMSDTVLAPTVMAQVLHPAWTRNQTENPALWICSDADPTSDNWSWPTGTANWPYTNSGSNFNKALHRVNATLHPAGTNSNLIVAPNDIFPWSDPTMIWISASNTLRVYFRYNITGNPLYYCDITSPVDSAWADVNGVSHLTFTYGACTIGGQPYTNSLVYATGEALAPSVFYSAKLSKYVLVTQMSAGTTAATEMPIVTLTSDDGIAWTVLKSAVLNNPTGLHRNAWHVGAMEADNKWFLFGDTSVSMTQSAQPDRVMCWVSNDSGSSWEIQLPSCTPTEDEFLTDPSFYKVKFDNNYRPWPIWDENGYGFVLFCGSLQDGDGYTTGSLGGEMVMRDATWNPYYKRQISPVNSVFSIMGIDFSDSYLAQQLISGSLAWPIIARDPANRINTFTLTSDGGAKITNATAAIAFWFTGNLPANSEVRMRLKTDAADRTYNYMSTHYGYYSTYFAFLRIYTVASTGNILRIKPYNYQGPIASTPQQLDSVQPITEPFTLLLSSIQTVTNGSKMQILRHNGYDSPPAVFTAPSAGLSANYWPTGAQGNVGISDSAYTNKTATLYWLFAKPAVVNEPIAAITPLNSCDSYGGFAHPAGTGGTGIEDLQALAMAWLSTWGQAEYNCACDANNDGIINMLDFVILANNWLKTE